MLNNSTCPFFNPLFCGSGTHSTVVGFYKALSSTLQHLQADRKIQVQLRFWNVGQCRNSVLNDLMGGSQTKADRSCYTIFSNSWYVREGWTYGKNKMLELKKCGAKGPGPILLRGHFPCTAVPPMAEQQRQQPS